MEEIDVDVKQVSPKHATSHTAPSISERGSCTGVIVTLGLLSVFLLVSLIIVGVLYHNSVHDSAVELWAIQDNLTELLQASNDKLSSMTEERDLLSTNLNEITEERDLLNTNLTKMIEEIDLLNTNLTKMIEERDLLNTNLTKMTEDMQMLQSSSKKKKPCPAGWKMFSCSCYFLSEESGSWDEGRQDCRDRGADLMVIDSPEKQTFLSGFTKRPTWIGLNDRDDEGIWKWVDETPLTLTYWDTNQPDNGGGIPKFGEEDCVHTRPDENTAWNDLSCASSLPWVCERIP
ncbi:CD209 antigen-like protein E [Mugil cephalus]|uniref:CD209 antigen-like protein E n=1 Tax=Mugil cephalus TaxID=48193 RepID=UPI001FB696EA|nr:CD209 antigen-like protein E [Mugil cephalus]